MLCKKPGQLQLGLVVSRELEALPQNECLPFLERVERRAKSDGDLQMLRAIKEYRSFQLLTKPQIKD
jgi:hypothetical protein